MADGSCYLLETACQYDDETEFIVDAELDVDGVIFVSVDHFPKNFS